MMTYITIVDTPYGATYLTDPSEVIPAARVQIIRTRLDYLNAIKAGAVTKDGTRPPLLPGKVNSYFTFELLLRLLRCSASSIEEQFMIDKTFQKPGAKIPLSVLYDEYTRYCELNSRPYLPVKKFGKVLRDVFGLEKRQTSSPRGHVTCVFGVEVID